MDEKRNYGGLDAFRLIAAFLVAAIHTSPFGSFSGEADFFLTRILARIAVPFFFMITGQFVLSDYLWHRNKNFAPILQYIRKVLMLYGIAIILYIPIGIYAGHYKEPGILSAFQMLFFEGTFYHLWYFPALITGILLLCFFRRFCSLRTCTVVVCLLYLIGLFGDSYWGLISDIPGISSLYEWGFRIYNYTRNGLFFAPLFLLMGAYIGCKNNLQKATTGLTGFLAAFLVMTTEGFLLKHFAVQRHDSMYLMLPVCMFFLYQLLLKWNRNPSKILRMVSTWIYILHPAMIVAVRGAAKILHLTTLLVKNSLIHYLMVCLLSVLVSLIITLLLTYFRKKPFEEDRAWIELDKNALGHNVSVLRSLLPENCELMPAIKADAYGHGAVLVAKELNRLDINAFCVACISEGIELRRNGVKGTILILGYTHPKQFPLLHRYRLTQTVVDYPYAEKLNQYGKKIHVHIGIDTGMHRLGERCENIDNLCRIFGMKNLKVDGAFTHLCAEDTNHPKDRNFTFKQAQAFFHVMDEIKRQGFFCPKLHLQSSYGILNYPELVGDYARVGIALYGVRSAENDYDRSKADLQPVLSLKARVASVRELLPGEAAGYGLAFIADSHRKIATLTIGYADGLPRSLSCGVGSVLINGCKAPIIGRICMDQTLADVTHISHVCAGDIAVIIGRSGDEQISVYELAEQSGTITNEILSRLGARLHRILNGHVC